MSTNAASAPSDKSPEKNDLDSPPVESGTADEVTQDTAQDRATSGEEVGAEAARQARIAARQPTATAARRPKIQVGSARRRWGMTERTPARPQPPDPRPPAESEETLAVEDPASDEEPRLEPDQGPAQAPHEAPAAVPSEEQEGQTTVKRTVPTPSRRDRLTPELERELHEAMANVSFEEIAGDSAPATGGEPLETDARTQGTVVRIHGDNVFFSLGGRNEGVVSLRQFREPPAIGAEMEVVVKRLHEEDGLYELSVPGASIEVSGWSDLAEGAIVEARITGANTGGLECMVSSIRGFIPASQIGIFRVEDFAEYIGQKIPCVATEVNRKRKNLVLSHRAIIEREKEAARQKFLESLEPGQTCEGVVRSIQDFGAFVDLGGIDGLVHISQLSWERVNHPSEVLHEGMKVKVKIEKVNRQTGKIALSYRDLLEHPWLRAEEKFPVGSVVKGPVSRIAKFGAFVKLAPGIEGLIHISELAHHHVRRVGDAVNEGQEVEVKVLSVDAQAQRIALSLKATLPEPAPEEDEAVAGHPQRGSAVAKSKRPLRGGFDRPTGGEQFGLRW